MRRIAITASAAASGKSTVGKLLFTSGSTGHPKGAVHLQHDLPYNTECYAKQVLGITKDDITLSVPKLFFGYATGTNLLFPFAVGGATALFPERSTAEKMFEMIHKRRPTILTTVPTMINSTSRMSASRCSTRARSRSGSTLGPLAGTGRDTGLVSLHQISVDISPPPLFSCWISAPAGTTGGTAIRDFRVQATANQSSHLD